MDTRNSLIISAALHEAQKAGLTDVLVGDNADELFGGSYDCYFDVKYVNDPSGWKIKRDGMANLPFVTPKLGNHYGIQIHQPFCDQNLFVKWALSTTTRKDCISMNNNSCRIQSRFGGPFEIQQQPGCGKIPLREAFCTVASYRRMDWIFRGSCRRSSCNNQDDNDCEEENLLENYYKTSSLCGISDQEFISQQTIYLQREGIHLKSKEHLYNIRIFQQVFNGLDNHPTKQRYPVGDTRGCVNCCFEIGDEQFCHLCDMYPAQHSSSSTTTT